MAKERNIGVVTFNKENARSLNLKGKADQEVKYTGTSVTLNLK
jgi:hypothetical protein